MLPPQCGHLSGKRREGVHPSRESFQLGVQSIEQGRLQPNRSYTPRRYLQRVDPEREPPMGAHMLTPRRGYIHHRIYVGRGCVVHYRGLSRGLSRGPVEEVSLAQFSRGHALWICASDLAGGNLEEVVRRARLRVGENRYRVLTDNCEHFCEWCIRGESRSYQVDALLEACLGWWRGRFLTQTRLRKWLREISAKRQSRLLSPTCP